MPSLRDAKHFVLAVGPALVVAGSYVAGLFAHNEIDKAGEGYKAVTDHTSANDHAALVATVTVGTAAAAGIYGLVEGAYETVKGTKTAGQALTSAGIYTVAGAVTGLAASGSVELGGAMANSSSRDQGLVGAGLGVGAVAVSLAGKHAASVVSRRAAAPAAGQGRV